ncbi:hypothetical protein [Xenorhabdus hominickii]|uniref:hypothetical protein n=1 Tax=Xenorhabdus hominickii TaxID=351679 RepID=UPI0011AB4AB5|nr:hypothetical protein [Xenorhabdus hominickii]
MGRFAEFVREFRQKSGKNQDDRKNGRLTPFWLTVNIFSYKNDPLPVRIAFGWRKNSRSLQGRAKLRYICTLLEADIARHLTHRLAVKVSRSCYAPAYHSGRAIIPATSTITMCSVRFLPMF